jgi:hypothetical protein
MFIFLKKLKDKIRIREQMKSKIHGYYRQQHIIFFDGAFVKERGK